MAVRNIVKDGDPVLRKQSRLVEQFDERLFTLLDDMRETMHQAEGVGLAAVQVGVLRRVVVIDIGEGLIELINPVITSQKGSQTDNEGCLSFPGEYGRVTRPNKVTVSAQDRHGNPFTIKGEGLLARAFCHEIDHLDGKLYVDLVEPER
ncbi:MAG: peptide deformylase [Oscillospiraceae bacterium]|nr:peptide deformylase [Oscillospiraceae bacterium]MBQ8731839.1 peptide deformylase [Oscillospiraceae bacterium]